MLSSTCYSCLQHCWGDAAYGQDDIVEPNDEWTAASGAQFQACGIRAGLVQCWSDLDLERAVQVPDIAPRSWGYTDKELRALVSPEQDITAAELPPASQSPDIESTVSPSPEEILNSPPPVTVSPSPDPIETEMPDTEASDNSSNSSSVETETPDTETSDNSSNSSSGGSSSGTTIGIAVGVSVAGKDQLEN